MPIDAPRTLWRPAATALLLAGLAAWPVQAEQAVQAAPAQDRATAPLASEGPISWYGARFAGRKTANGERFDPKALTMAHKELAFGTRVRVTNLANSRSVVLRVNDRGPATPGRIGDVSHAAAQQLRMVRSGVVRARLEVVN